MRPPSTAPCALALVLTAALPAVTACGGSRALPLVPARSQIPPAEVRVGMLVYEPIPPVKSVRAYLGDAFRLQTPSGELVLGPTEAVPEARLAAAAGKVVAVTCDLRPPVAPEPYESYPQGPDGRPLERPPVREVRVLEVPPAQ
jgi:hypothetical protein